MTLFRLPSAVHAAGARERLFRRRGSGVACAGTAMEVPWRVVFRSAQGERIRVQNISETPLHSVRFALAAGSLLGLSLPQTVYPGECLRVTLRMPDAAVREEPTDQVLIVRWFTAEGQEFLWPIVV